jgi:hypothetical protein
MPDQMRTHLHLALPSYPKPAGPEERHDGMLFPGFVMIALAAAALARRQVRRMPLTHLYAALAVAAFALSLGPEPTVWGHRLLPAGPYAWLDSIVPVLDALRVPARFASIVDLALTVLAAFGATAILRPRGARAAAIITASLALLACFEGYGAVPLAEVGPRGHTRAYGLYDWLGDQPPGAVVELPIGRLDGHYRAFVYEYNTLVQHHPIVNGWTGYTTELQQFLGSDASPFRNRDQLSDGLDLLRGLGVRYLIFHPDDFDSHDDAAPILNALLADSSRWTAMQRFGPAFAFTLPPRPARLGAASDRIAPATMHARLALSIGCCFCSTATSTRGGPR